MGSVLSGLARSPDLNFIENVCGKFTNLVYQNSKQHSSVEVPKLAIEDVWFTPLMAQEENEEDFPGRLLHQAALWGNAELLEDLLHGEMVKNQIQRGAYRLKRIYHTLLVPLLPVQGQSDAIRPIASACTEIATSTHTHGESD
ncbi:hypothetical protein AVEN_82407-1 [Araneus ventricosus]|uniref:Uncharacterized protein n=1 Tax=Araneus ventricosus TaxID=182803 RepID=A0A4Y2L1A3_ARAVE|nr:hypothetical protein AVEN_82407-1 [Araneus ventricosus]